MANHSIFLHLNSVAKLVHSSIGFYNGFSTSTCGSATIYALASRVQRQQLHKENPCSETAVKYLLSKTRSAGLEKYLEYRLVTTGFSISEVDPCLFYCSSVIFLVCIDDCLLFSPTDEAIDEVLKDLFNPIKTRGKQFTIEDQGPVNDFLGIKVHHQAGGTILLSQASANRLHHTRPTYSRQHQ